MPILIPLLVEYLLDWRFLAVVFLLLNLKSIPISWHARALYHLLQHYRGRPYVAPSGSSTNVPSTSGSSTNVPSTSARAVDASITAIEILFRPTVMTTRAPLLEADFNWHKSNSTFFSDLDISRLEVMTRVYTAGWSAMSKELADEGHKGRPSFTLGSVFCSFRRPLRPYERYQVSSRVLCWDRKWLYVVSWFSRPNGKHKDVSEKTAEVVAYALSKYVCKKGRFTVAPGRILHASGLLPWSDESGSSSTANGGPPKNSTQKEKSLAPRSIGRLASHEQRWAQVVKKERLRGLEVARSFISLDDACAAEIAHLLTDPLVNSAAKSL